MTTEIVAVTSADDKFSVGLAGTLSSALQSLRKETRLKLYVLDGGITVRNRDALEQHWNDSRLKVEWISVDRRAVSNFVVSDHVTDATYYRLLAPELLPSDVDKFIYLDADMLVVRDLTTLWNEPLKNSACLAVQDAGAPFIDSDIALADRENARRYCANLRPIPNYAALGLSPVSPYFNGGLLVVNLKLWRQDRLAHEMLRVLRDNAKHVTYWDQYALNVVLNGRWNLLDPRWNQNSYILKLPGWQETMFTHSEYWRYVRDPWIVHFNWIKPWQAGCEHPYGQLFRSKLRGSPWEVPEPVAPVRPHVPLVKSAHNFLRVRVRRLRHGIYALLGRKAA